LKKFEIDCNFNYLEPEKPTVSQNEVKTLSLVQSEKVIVFQDDDEWIGVVVHDDSLPEMYQWYIDITA
jgi:hypothetical protein